MKRQLTTTVLGLATIALSGTVSAQQDRLDVDLPDGEAKPLIEGACIACHRLSFITNSVGNSQEDWDKVLSTMLALPDEQMDTITSYLAEHFPKKEDSHPRRHRRSSRRGDHRVALTDTWLAAA